MPEAQAESRRRIVIDPITRLEGHGKIDIFLDEVGDVEKAYFQVPELRGFEKFAEGRLAEDMPQITSRICGVCPTAHHMAATKALDDLYRVEPPPAAKLIRELVYSVFMLEDHALHFYFLGGPDFVLGPGAPPAERNVLGVIHKVGLDVGHRVIGMRRELRDIIGLLGGKAVHPVLGLPGGVARRVKPEEQAHIQAVAERAVEFARFTMGVFTDVVLAEPRYVDLLRSDAFTHRTYYMGMVDDELRPNFYDGKLRVVSPNGDPVALFSPKDYLSHVAEHVEPWTYVKFCYLKAVGWNGFKDGPESGIYSVAPLARMNVAKGMATPEAHAAYERMFDTLGGKPVHHTLANHWARVVEMLYAAERMREIAGDPGLSDPHVRVLPDAPPTEGIGVVEAPRGTLIHHYRTDERGIVRKANLIVATQNNAARIAMSVEKAARSLIRRGEVTDEILNKVEMAFRAYDPCHACASHSLPGSMPLVLSLRNEGGAERMTLRRDRDGRIHRS